jgi:hypothetical protein
MKVSAFVLMGWFAALGRELPEDVDIASPGRHNGRPDLF